MKINITSKSFLIVSSIVFIVFGLFAGLSPRTFAWVANIFLLPEPTSDALLPFLRIGMGVLIGMSVFMLCGAFVERYHKAALLFNLLCFAGVITGALISFIADGFPSLFAIFIFSLSLIFFIISLWYVLKQNVFEK